MPVLLHAAQWTDGLSASSASSGSQLGLLNDWIVGIDVEDAFAIERARQMAVIDVSFVVAAGLRWSETEIVAKTGRGMAAVAFDAAGEQGQEHDKGSDGGLHRLCNHATELFDASPCNAVPALAEANSTLTVFRPVGRRRRRPLLHATVPNEFASHPAVGIHAWTRRGDIQARTRRAELLVRSGHRAVLASS